MWEHQERKLGDRRRSGTVGPCVIQISVDLYDALYAVCPSIDDNPEMPGIMDQKDSNVRDEVQSKRLKLMDELEIGIPELKGWLEGAVCTPARHRRQHGWTCPQLQRWCPEIFGNVHAGKDWR